MKKIFCLILTVCMIFCLFTSTDVNVQAASGKCGYNLTWRVENNVLTISGTGAMYNYNGTTFSSGNAPWLWYMDDFSDDPPIYKIIIEEGVTSIGTYAFAGVTLDWDIENMSSTYTVTEVYIPDTVTKIGEKAFYTCNNLETIRFPEGDFEIDYAAFYKCYNLKSISIPEECTKISSSAFAYCSNVESVYIGSGVTQISPYAFKGCTKLKNITVSENNMFYSSLNGNLYDKNKTFLHTYALGNYVEEFILPDTVTTIGKGAIYCDNSSQRLPFKTIVIPVSVTRFEEDGLYALVYAVYCPHFNVRYLGTKEQWTEISIDESGNSLNSARQYNISFTEPEIISQGKCGENLSWTVYNNNSLKISGSGAMYDYTQESPAPWNEYSLTIKSVAIPKTATYIGNYAFDGFNSLNKVHYESNSRYWNKLVIGSNNEVLSSATIIYGEEEVPYGKCGDNLEWVVENITLTISGTGAMYDYDDGTPWYFEAVEKLVIEDGVTYIGSSAFSDMGITSVSFPDSVTEIGAHAFSSCVRLSSVDFNKVQKIGDRAFAYCYDRFDSTGLKTVTIGDYVTEIGTEAFKNSTGLSTVTIGKNVEVIGVDAFNARYMQTFYVSDENANYSTVDGVLFNKDKTVLIKYPCGRSDKGYAIPETVTEINSSAFSFSQYLRGITIPASVTKIGKNILSESSYTPAVYYTGTQAQWDAIDINATNPQFNTSAVTFITPPKEITWDVADGVLTVSGTGEISNYTSSNSAPWSSYSNSITSVVVEEGITAIGNQAFASLDKLNTVSLPESVTSIGNYAFANCKVLETVNMYGTTNKIGTAAFNNCYYLSNVNINGDFEDYMALDIAKTNLPFERADITYTHENGNVYASMSIYARWAYDTTTKILYITNYPYVASRDMLNYKTTNAVPWYEFINEIEKVEVSGVASLGSYSLIGSTSLKEAVIDDIVKRVNSWAFYKCASLEKVKLGSSITAIGTGAFNGTDSLVLAEFNNTKASYDSLTFGKYNNPITRVTTTLTDGVTGYQGGNVYWNIKNGVLTVTGKGAMTSISSPEKAPWYEYRNEVTKIVIEKGVTSVAKNAFNDFAKLQTVEIGEGVTTIGTYAFKNSAVKTVYLPATIQTVGTSSFSSCGKLTAVVYNGSEENFGKVTVGGGNTRFVSATKTFNK